MRQVPWWRLLLRGAVLTPMVSAIVVAGGIAGVLAYLVLPGGNPNPPPRGTVIAAPTDVPRATSTPARRSAQLLLATSAVPPTVAGAARLLDDAAPPATAAPTDHVQPVRFATWVPTPGTQPTAVATQPSPTPTLIFDTALTPASGAMVIQSTDAPAPTGLGPTDPPVTAAVAPELTQAPLTSTPTPPTPTATASLGQPAIATAIPTAIPTAAPTATPQPTNPALPTDAPPVRPSPSPTPAPAATGTSTSVPPPPTPLTTRQSAPPTPTSAPPTQPTPLSTQPPAPAPAPRPTRTHRP